MITILQPCQENWEEMLPVDQGKFCSRCAKTVIDLTSKNDEEIIHLLNQSENGSCGRLNHSQLNRELITDRNKPMNHPWLNLATSVLLLMAGKIVSAQESKSADAPIYKTEQNTISTKTIKDTNKHRISGCVKDSLTHEILIGAHIVVQGTELETTSDLDGNFELIIPDEMLDDTITLIITYLTFNPFILKISEQDLPLELDFLLGNLNNQIVTNEVRTPVAMGYAPLTIIQKAKRKRRKSR